MTGENGHWMAEKVSQAPLRPNLMRWEYALRRFPPHYKEGRTPRHGRARGPCLLEIRLHDLATVGPDLVYHLVRSQGVGWQGLGYHGSQGDACVVRGAEVVTRHRVTECTLTDVRVNLHPQNQGIVSTPVRCPGTRENSSHKYLVGWGDNQVTSQPVLRPLCLPTAHYTWAWGGSFCRRGRVDSCRRRRCGGCPRCRRRDSRCPRGSCSNRVGPRRSRGPTDCGRPRRRGRSGPGGSPSPR